MNLFIFVFILFICFFIFLFWAKKHFNDPYYIEIFFGLPGCGKSTDISKYAIKVLNGKTPYHKVYCNQKEVAGTYYFDLKNLIAINKDRSENNYIIPFEPNSCVCIDEASMYVNNRDWKNFSKFMQYLCRYVRHHKIYLRFYSQSLDTDKVIRDLSRRVYIMTKLFYCITLIKPVRKDIGIGEDTDGNGHLVENYSYLSIFNYQFNFIPRYIGLFDSHEVKTKCYQDNSIYYGFNDNVKYAQNLKAYILHIFRNLYNSFFYKIKKLIVKVERV